MSTAKGRPPKPAAAKAKAGTARKDRRTIADAAPPPPAVDLSAPQSVRDNELETQWDTIIHDLDACGIITKTDLLGLETALAQYHNYEIWQLQLAETLSDPEASASDKTKTQGAINSALSSYHSIIAGLERSVKLRPKAEKGEEWEK